MRKGFNGLAAVVQGTLQANPFGGHVFVFRGRRGDIIKVLWFDGQGLLLLAKRLERGRFVWPQASEGRVVHGPAVGLRSRRSPGRQPDAAGGLVPLQPQPQG